jgi:Protein of unknown function (DUF3592)
VPTAESVVNSILRNRSTFLRYAFILTLFGGLLLCGLGYFIGRTHLRLVLKGARAQGTIVDYRAETFTTRRFRETISTSTGYMPVVEYTPFGDKKVRFQDWLGSSVEGNRNQVVQVLYDPVNPSVAIIDRPVWNWIPWVPIIAVGLLLIMSGIRSGLRSLFGTSSWREPS